jgi:hypothetical protein
VAILGFGAGVASAVLTHLGAELIEGHGTEHRDPRGAS